MTSVKVIKRPLNMSGKKMQNFIENGYVLLTFAGEHVHPFHAFALKEDLERLSHSEAVLKFKHFGEVFHAKFSKFLKEGLFFKRLVHHFEIVDAPKAANILNFDFKERRRSIPACA